MRAMTWVLFSLFAVHAAGAQGEEASSPAERIVITAVGDVNLGSAYPDESGLPPDGGASLLEGVRAELAGDVVFANLEGPLADGGVSQKCGPRSRQCYAFRTPTAYVRHLKEAGFTVVSLANNHVNDFGEEGRQSTLRTLDEAGIRHSGPVGDVARLVVRDRSLVLIAFAAGTLSHNLLDIEDAARRVKELSASGDLVLVSFHGGTEGAKAGTLRDEPEFLGGEPRGHLVQFAHAMIDAGASLVIGHGPHVVRGLEVYRGRLIAYSLGNFCTYGGFNLSGSLGRAVILKAELDPRSGAFVTGRLIATRQEGRGIARLDPEGMGLREVRALSLADFPYSHPEIGEDGALCPGAGDGEGLFTLADSEKRKKLRELLDELSRRGLSKEALRRAFGDRRAGLLPEVLTRFAKPAEALPWEKYRPLFIDEAVLESARAFLAEHAELLSRVEEKYQVDRTVVAAIVGVETKFGKKRGNFPAFNVFATLSLLDARRGNWARNQLAALLSVFAADPLAVVGSYAGAVGLVQFIPSSIRTYGVDFDGDGRIDLDTPDDALASAANYLKGEGWKRARPIVRGGVNYRAIFRYNPAHHYARVVKELAEALGHPAEAPPAPKKTPAPVPAPAPAPTPAAPSPEPAPPSAPPAP